jgi:hypothetical protein
MTEARILDNILNIEDISGYNVTLAFARYREGNNIPDFRRLPISSSLKTEFQNIINEMFKRFRGYRRRSELRLISYSPEYKPENYDVEWIKISDNEFIKNIIDSIPTPSNIPLTDNNLDFINGLTFYILVLEDQSGIKYYYFRIYKPNKVIECSKNIFIKKVGQIYERMIEPVYQFDKYYDVVLNNDHLFIFNKNNFHNIFKYYQEILQMAEETLNKVITIIPIENFDVFRESCLKNSNKLSKLRNIANKAYLETITMEDMKRVIASHGLEIDIANNNGTEKLVYNSSNQWGILNLLEDCYLNSGMTGLNYEANSKREQSN